MASTLETQETGGPTAVRRSRVLKSVLAWVVVLTLAYFIWPTSLGGGTTAIVVNGHSMEPTYYTGDVVVARADEPEIGDVVIYTTEDLGDAKIIHRIIGGDGVNGWEIQGDNNDFVDPFHPTNEDVLGVAKFHIDSVGTWATVLRSPSVWASFLLLALGLVMWPSRRCPDLESAEHPTDAEDRA
ncbi:signal peptidase I [Demequina flava]|uniref:signal peptidase I n=1 Tax=Demequina flava TaxID=1095025 RepID=UPI000783FBA5|nr:signal peptidase I [Demequina flava]